MALLHRRLLKWARVPFSSTRFESAFRRLTIGRDQNSWISRIPPKHSDYRRPSLRTLFAGDVTLEVDVSDFLGWYVYWAFSDPARQRLWSLIRSGDVVVDVGANLGEVTLQAASLVGSEGSVHSFEPFPGNFDQLCRNLELNDFDNITVNSLGLGAYDERLSMVVPNTSNQGMNRIKGKEKDGFGAESEVQLTTLDKYVHNRRLARIDVLKIDVEGFEMNVLKGGYETIRSKRPKIFLEVIDKYLRLQDSSAIELALFLEDLGYRLTHAGTGEEVSSDSLPPEPQYDLIAYPLTFEKVANARDTS